MTTYNTSIPFTATTTGASVDIINVSNPGLTQIRVVNQGSSTIGVITGSGGTPAIDGLGVYPVPGSGGSMVFPLKPTNTQSTITVQVVGSSSKYSVLDI